MCSIDASRLEWKQVRIPKQLLKDVRSIIREHPLWLNEPDFIRDALREKIEEVRRKHPTQDSKAKTAE